MNIISTGTLNVDDDGEYHMSMYVLKCNVEEYYIKCNVEEYYIHFLKVALEERKTNPYSLLDVSTVTLLITTPMVTFHKLLTFMLGFCCFRFLLLLLHYRITM